MKVLLLKLEPDYLMNYALTRSWIDRWKYSNLTGSGTDEIHLGLICSRIDETIPFSLEVG